MLRIAVAVMLLAGSAFGAVTFTVPATIDPDADGNALLPVWLNVGSERVNGFDVLLKAEDPADVPGLRITGRTLPSNPVFDVATKTLNQLNVDMQGNGAPNLGAAKSDAYGFATNMDRIEIATFKIHVTDMASLPVNLVLSNGGWFGPFNDDIGDVEAIGPIADAIVTITPEPASMLLLAAGAAFFARRRRA